jgi:hypothetical protein
MSWGSFRLYVYTLAKLSAVKPTWPRENRKSCNERDSPPTTERYLNRRQLLGCLLLLLEFAALLTAITTDSSASHLPQKLRQAVMLGVVCLDTAQATNWMTWSQPMRRDIQAPASCLEDDSGVVLQTLAPTASSRDKMSPWRCNWRETLKRHKCATRSAVFSDLTLCSSEKARRFGAVYHPHLQGRGVSH